MTIEQLQAELTRAMDFITPSWWGEAERQQHRDRIKKLEDALDFEIRADAFEEAYDKHIEEMAVGPW